eukprot:scaffold5935_cov137-Isochrysis_galbana.AAC.2
MRTCLHVAGWWWEEATQREVGLPCAHGGAARPLGRRRSTLRLLALAEINHSTPRPSHPRTWQGEAFVRHGGERLEPIRGCGACLQSLQALGRVERQVDEDPVGTALHLKVLEQDVRLEEAQNFVHDVLLSCDQGRLKPDHARHCTPLLSAYPHCRRAPVRAQRS